MFNVVMYNKSLFDLTLLNYDYKYKKIIPNFGIYLHNNKMPIKWYLVYDE